MNVKVEGGITKISQIFIDKITEVTNTLHKLIPTTENTQIISLWQH